MAKKSEKIEKNASIRGLDDSFVPYPTTFGIDKTIFNSRGNDLEVLYSMVKKSPEVQAAIQAIVEDIMADEWKHIGSKYGIKKAEEFEFKVKFYKVLSNALYDFFTTGNAYILKLSVDEDRVKEIMQVLTKQMSKDLSMKFKKEAEVLVQEIKVPKDLQLLKSSTVKINYDETGRVTSFVQTVKNQTRVYRKQDVIHLSMINLGGENYGFTPLESLQEDLATLLFAKDYVGKYFENNGTPDYIFTMPKENPDSRNYKLLKSEMIEMKKKQEKHRNMLLTGEITVQEVTKFNKDMEFSKLIEHFTQIILIGLGVPAYRINYTLTSKQAGGEVNRAFEGYYKKISFWQKILEIELNTSLFYVFNVDLKFNRAYKIDEMREAQVAQLLAQIGAVSLEEIREKIGMERDLPKGETMPTKAGDGNEVDFDEDKRRSQGRDNNPENPDKKTDNKLKTIGGDIADLEFNQFVRLVEGYAGEGKFDQAKILYVENDKEFVLYFNDGTWKYQTIVGKLGINVEAFRVERLRNAVKLLR